MFESHRLVIIAGAAVAVVIVGALLWWLLGASGSCGSDDAAKAKALALSADMQAAAQAGTLKIKELASVTRTMNAASDAYTSSHDRGAYCTALDKIRSDMKLAL